MVSTPADVVKTALAAKAPSEPVPLAVKVIVSAHADELSSKKLSTAIAMALGRIADFIYNLPQVPNYIRKVCKTVAELITGLWVSLALRGYRVVRILMYVCAKYCGFFRERGRKFPSVFSELGVSSELNNSEM
jgi:hypothetical protein